MKKTCTKCNESKDINLFVVCKRNKDGHGSKCKECHKKVCANYLNNNQHKRKETCAIYYTANRSECIKRSINQQKKNPDSIKKYKTKYIKNNTEKIVNYRKEFGHRNLIKMKNKYPIHFKARNKVNNAVANGYIPRATTLKCSNCDNQAKEYHHHLGYEIENWLQIIPVCKSCHIILDSKQKSISY